MLFQNAEQLTEFVRDSDSADRAGMEARVRGVAQTALYYEGHHWQAMDPATYRKSPQTVRGAEWSPDSPAIRVTDNFITSLAVKLSAQTEPSALEAQVDPGEREHGVEAENRAQVAEDAITASLHMAGAIEARRQANWLRTLTGDAVVGLSLSAEPMTIQVNGRDMTLPNRRVRTFVADPSCIVLDPYEESRCLEEHEWVRYRTIWTYSKLARMYPEVAARIDKGGLRLIGDIVPLFVAVGIVSGGRLFAQYKTNSHTPGVVVHQIHEKDETGRFSRMSVAIEGLPDERELAWVNQDDPTSPFGGCGMPFFKYGYHRRMGSPWSISDVRMTLHDQNRRNIFQTAIQRYMAKWAGAQWMVDERWAGKNKEGLVAQLTNRQWGVVMGSAGQGQRPIPEPKLIEHQPPPPFIAELAERERISALEKVHRPDIARGVTKSHVPDATNQAALERADEVGSSRIREDLETDARLLKTMLGTMILNVRGRSPGVLAELHRRRWDADALATLAKMDPYEPGVTIRVRESSVRARSHQSRKRDLETALMNQAIDGKQFRRGMAIDLDSPLFADDAYFERQANKAARAVVAGRRWSPMRLGTYHESFLSAFRRALLSREAQADPAVAERLNEAINLQSETASLEAIESDPALRAQMEQANAQAAAGAGAEGGQAQPQRPQAASVGDVLAMLQGGAPTAA